MTGGEETFLPIVIMFIIVSLIGFIASLLGKYLGPKRYFKSKMATYECGMPITGSARDRISVKYYLVAILFLLFDLEAAFLLPVALAWKKLILIGWPILAAMGFFLLFFIVGLWYEFKVKVLEWET